MPGVRRHRAWYDTGRTDLPGQPADGRGGSVRLAGLSKRYAGGTDAVNGLDLEITDGEFFAIVGPSGSGKTTTLRMIGGFERPTSGEIWIGGQSVANTAPFQRNVNTVFQSYALFPHLNVAGNVAFGLRMAHVPRSEREFRVGEALDLVRLKALAHRSIKQLSGGEQQRVALARALVNHPSVLLLDEPLGSLDLKLRQEMQLELKAIQERVGITFIHVTHDQDEAMALADRIAVMHQGRILQLGTAEEIYERPATRFVAGFFGSINLFNGTVTSVQNGTIDVAASGLGRFRGPISLVAKDRPVTNGDSVAVAIRPECVEVHAPTDAEASNASQNVYSGVVRRVIYGGSERRYEIDLTEGASIEAKIAGPQPTITTIVAGTPVTVTWPAEASKVLLD
jgi:spermidine/putrescine transport system ATP-binding protein